MPVVTLIAMKPRDCAPKNQLHSCYGSFIMDAGSKTEYNAGQGGLPQTNRPIPKVTSHRRHIGDPDA
jgi:hypothetical protein